MTADVHQLAKWFADDYMNSEDAPIYTVSAWDMLETGYLAGYAVGERRHWISAEVQLPEIGAPVLVFEHMTGGEYMTLGRRLLHGALLPGAKDDWPRKQEWWFQELRRDAQPPWHPRPAYVTHWMPLPESPK